MKSSARNLLPSPPPAKIDLEDLAKRNAADLERRFLELLERSNKAQTRKRLRFSRRVELRGRVSLNLRQGVLNSFLAFGEHQNIYEWAAWRARFSRKSAAQILRYKLGTFHDRRLAFDDRFHNGRALRYGALNIGGLGAVAYGEYCVVLNGRAVRRLKAAYLWADSLKTYLRQDQLDADRLAREIAPHSGRHQLATLKHRDRLLNLPEREWPRLLCSEIDFIEVLLQGPLKPQDVREIRLETRDLEQRFDHVFEEFRHQLDLASRFLIDEFAMVWRQLDEHEIPLQAVDA